MPSLRQCTYAALQLLLILAFTARSLVPAGFMPEKPQNGTLVALTICTGTGQATLYLPAENTPQEPSQKDHSGKKNQSPCVFAAAFATGVLPSQVTDLSAPPHTTRLSFLPPAASITASFEKSYHAQAPPSLVLTA